MNCTLCGLPLKGVTVEVYGCLYHPECRQEIVKIPVTYGAEIATTANLTTQALTIETKLEQVIQDALWKNKTRFGNYRG